MKKLMVTALVVLFLFMSVDAFAQLSRKPQIEAFAGVAFPMGPDYFKDYHKVGFSGHGQYVIFPSPKLGVSFGAAFETFTFDGDAFLEDIGAANMGVEVDGSANILELGIGVRPYITPVEANTQIFLFGMGTYNFLKAEYTVTGTDIFGNTQEEKVEGDENKPGVAVGGGLEMPAGESFNLIIQGLFRFVFTDEETTTFLGVTAGLVF